MDLRVAGGVPRVRARDAPRRRLPRVSPLRFLRMFLVVRMCIAQSLKRTYAYGRLHLKHLEPQLEVRGEATGEMLIA